MHYIPYSCQTIEEEDITAVSELLRSEYLTQGPVGRQFEQAFAQLHGVAHGVSVANATAGLHIACLALGLKAGDVAWTSPNSFLASANCVLYCGATVDFVDIDPATRNMSISALEMRLEQAAAVGRLPRVVIPVDFAGLPCDLKEMRGLADRYGFAILEDASHATGASYLGQPTGSEFADISVFSFHAVKIVTTAEGGMVTTQNDDLAETLRRLRSHGMTRNPSLLENASDGPWYYEQLDLGFNYRMTDLQAALGLSQLRRLDAMHDARKALANRYDSLLAELPLKLPHRSADRDSAWHLYAVEIDKTRTGADRRAVFEALKAANIGVNVHYIPIHTQPYYEALGFGRQDFPASVAYYDQAISLPLFPRLTPDEQAYVADILRTALNV